MGAQIFDQIAADVLALEAESARLRAASEENVPSVAWIGFLFFLWFIHHLGIFFLVGVFFVFPLVNPPFGEDLAYFFQVANSKSKVSWVAKQACSSPECAAVTAGWEFKMIFVLL